MQHDTCTANKLQQKLTIQILPDILNVFFVCNFGRIFEILLRILIFFINFVITKLLFIEAPIFDTVRW